MFNPFGEGADKDGDGKGDLKGDVDPDPDNKDGFGATPLDEEFMEAHTLLKHAREGGTWVTILTFQSMITAPGVMTRYVAARRRRRWSRKTYDVIKYKLPGFGDELYWGTKGIQNGNDPFGFPAGENGGENIRDHQGT